jgi:hypothetical protein
LVLIVSLGETKPGTRPIRLPNRMNSQSVPTSGKNRAALWEPIAPSTMPYTLSAMTSKKLRRFMRRGGTRPLSAVARPP